LNVDDVFKRERDAMKWPFLRAICDCVGRRLRSNASFFAIDGLPRSDNGIEGFNSIEALVKHIVWGESAIRIMLGQLAYREQHRRLRLS
jgi:hypothetical protein